MAFAIYPSDTSGAGVKKAPLWTRIAVLRKALGDCRSPPVQTYVWIIRHKYSKYISTRGQYWLRNVARTALLTVGRFPAALTLARGLHEHGVRVIVADPLKRQLCSVSRAVAKTFQVAPPNSDIAGWERDILDIIELENVTDLIPTSEEVVTWPTSPPACPRQRVT